MSKRRKTTQMGSGDNASTPSMGFALEMRERTGLASLPEELLCFIANDLDDRDIAACELATPSWNEAFARPLVVRDRIARSFPRLLHQVDTQVVSGDEMRQLYRKARRAVAIRRLGRFDASMAEYPLRDGETNFASDILPPDGTSYTLKRNQDPGKTFGMRCLPSTWTVQYHRGCLAWRLTDQFTIIDHLDTMRREIIEWPGHEELATWNKENHDPNHTPELNLAGFSEDLVVFYEERPLLSHQHGHMVVYHRGLKQWRTVKLPENWLANNARFFVNAATVVFRATVPEAEPPAVHGPRRGVRLRGTTRGRRVRRSLHRWNWQDGEATGFQPLESAELPWETYPTIDNQVGPLFHPAAPDNKFAVIVKVVREPSRWQRWINHHGGPDEQGDGGIRIMVLATAIKYCNGIPTGTRIEYISEPLGDSSEYLTLSDYTEFCFSPSNDQGENIVATIYRKPGVREEYERVHVFTFYFDVIKERFSLTMTPGTASFWPDAPRDLVADLEVMPFVWGGMLHYNIPVHPDFADQHLRLCESPVDAFVRFMREGEEDAEGPRDGCGYFPVPSPEKWDMDSQVYNRIMSDDRYLILLHLEGYVVWCFDKQHDDSGSGWQTWNEQQSLVAEVRNRIEDRQEAMRRKAAIEMGESSEDPSS